MFGNKQKEDLGLAYGNNRYNLKIKLINKYIFTYNNTPMKTIDFLT